MKHKIITIEALKELKAPIWIVEYFESLNIKNIPADSEIYNEIISYVRDIIDDKLRKVPTIDEQLSSVYKAIMEDNIPTKS